MFKKNNLTYLFFATLTSFSLLAFAADAVKVESETKNEETSTKPEGKFPETVKFSVNDLSGDLKLTGVTTVKKFFVKVYEGGHYMQNPPKSKGAEAVKEILSDQSGVKQIQMHWLRNIPAVRIQNGFKDVFVRDLGTGAGYDKFKPAIDQFNGFFSHDVTNADVNTLYWLPGGTLVVMFNDQKMGEIKNPEFAKIVWELWFGPNVPEHAKGMTSKL